MRRSYNKREEDFPSAKEYDDFLEEGEDISEWSPGGISCQDADDLLSIQSAE